MELKTTLERVAFLLETIKITRINYSALIVLYWKVFDNIDIPDEIINKIISSGTKPETISRAKRKIHEIKISKIGQIFKDFLNDKERDDNGKGNESNYNL